MPVPTTTLDLRFSEPDSHVVSWDDTVRVLTEAQLFWITTVRADGRPHVTPLVAVWCDDAIHFCTGADEQKAINLAGNPNVVLITGCNDWEQGVDVMVEGVATRARDEVTLHRLADAWRSKWNGDWDFEVRDGAFHHDGGGEALVFRVAPAKVLAFGKSPFTHTRHRF